GKPLVLFPLLALTVVGASAGVNHRRSRKKRRSGQGPPPRSKGLRPVRNPDRIRTVVPAATALAAVGCAIALFAAWTLPRTERDTRLEEYRQTVALTYSATAPAGATYPDGTVETGEPIF